MSQEKCIQKKHLAFTAIIIVPFPISVIILKFANLNEKKKKKTIFEGKSEELLIRIRKEIRTDLWLRKKINFDSRKEEKKNL